MGFQEEAPDISTVISPSINAKKYAQNRPNMMNIFGHDPVMLAISSGVFSLTYMGIVELKTPAQKP
jgi:hypothetical protein